MQMSLKYLFDRVVALIGLLVLWKVLAIGGGFSLLIEVLQFVLKRGFAEFDDVFHNLLGCAIGFLGYLALAHVVKRVSRRGRGHKRLPPMVGNLRLGRKTDVVRD